MAALLKGTAFITGAGSAYAFAAHGIRNLALCDINPQTLATTTQHLKTQYPDLSILELEMDTSVESSVETAIATTIREFSRLDIAVNNAGIGGSVATHLSSLESWRRTMSINLDGVWLCQRAQIQQMVKQSLLEPAPRGNRGVIVNVASMLGLVASATATPAVAYTASKHGVMGLTKTDAVMYAEHGIRINAICPGYVGTPLLKAAMGSGIMVAEVEKVAQKRLGEMEEVADGIVFLASRMSSFMTGQGMAVDGGYTCQ
ncbi:hypothetical protein LTR62_004029 [Meristemomyces frigidus]|uniref:Uncharacterized protein n=1 Tax=Meristemomyces frigidus TaxID=1508187 RepID=A0AAN7TR89_9PEZI|nr:hypothetical protein LTR62_004029 [Meristemomyces frigidus]